MSRMMRQIRSLLSVTLVVIGAPAFVERGGAQIPTVPPPGNNAPATQSSYPTCQPPNPGEYLLLVVSQTSESQDQVKRTLPPSTTSTVCNYVNEVVTRVSGFTSVDTANAWARYLSESAGLSAFVARPATSSSNQAPATSPTVNSPPAVQTSKPASLTPKPPVQAATVALTKPAAFNPKPLGTGYAVLVNYFSRPELALQVRQLLSQEIGLVSYTQRPYLLAAYTADQNQAHAILQKLTERGFWAMVVDSRRVTLLRQSVTLKN